MTANGKLKTRDSGIDLTRLCRSIARSRQNLRSFREKRRQMVADYAGHNWTGTNWMGQSVGNKDPVNALSQLVQGLTRAIVAKDPRVLISSGDSATWPAASIMEAWANKESERSYLGRTLQKSTADALFWVGIVKVALEGPAEAAAKQYGTKAGMPYACAIDPEDWFYDPAATSLSPLALAYEGHKLRVPLAAIRDDSFYGKSRKLVQKTDWRPYTYEGDQKLSALGRMEDQPDDEFRDMTDICEVYVPSERLTYVFAWEWVHSGFPRDAEPLAVVPWVGPDCGPYHHLAFMEVPNNSQPKGPMMDQWDLHRQENDLYRKIFEQSSRAKQVVTVGPNDQDARAVAQAQDGQAIRVDDPDKIRVQTYGQPDQLVFQMASWCGQLFSKQAGNMEAMFGLSPQASTATQEKLLTAGATQTLADYRDTAARHASEVFSSLCWYWWNHPDLVMKAEYKSPGSAVPMQRQSYPNLPQYAGSGIQRKGRYEDLNVRVDPYSMQLKTPDQKFSELVGILTQVYMPLAQLWMQQGVGLDATAIWRDIGRLKDIPDFDKYIQYSVPVQPQAGGDGGNGVGVVSPGGPREYVRSNRSADTPGADAQAVAEGMAAASNQQSQQNAA